MKNKKGFTLIELLAVIVVLAIIALIITPIISKIVGSATEQANMRSVEGHIGNINNNLAAKMLTDSGLANGTYTFGALGFNNYPSTDPIRCDSYEVSKNRVIQATGCDVRGKDYCYGNSKASSCEGVFEENVNVLTMNKVNQIRSTGNTDISGRTGPIYYVSEDGNNANDGLSPETPWKTLTKVRDSFTNKVFPEGSTILFRRGDTFTGYFGITNSDILIGSYGDESLPKPILSGSSYDGAVNGSWTEVKPNIWKYVMNNNDVIHKKDVGMIYFFCNEGNDNCDTSISAVPQKFKVGNKIMTNSDVVETEDMLTDLLKNDLDFYHMGHTYGDNNDGKALYVYSTSNPKTRFNSIKFSYGGHGIKVSTYNNIVVDNLDLRFYGNSAVNSNAISNLTVTNCEISFIGGMISSFNGVVPNRVTGYGVSVTSYITSRNGYPVDKGLYVYNNYIYEVFNGAVTFYSRSAAASPMEKVTVDNNVIEYCNSGLRYLNYTTSTTSSDISKTYLGQIHLTNNIVRYAGMGISSIRTDDTGGLVYNGPITGSNFNHINSTGEVIIENNIFDTTREGVPTIDIASDSTLPQFRNNKIYNYSNRTFGYFHVGSGAKTPITFSAAAENSNLSSNEIILYDK